MNLSDVILLWIFIIFKFCTNEADFTTVVSIRLEKYAFKGNTLDDDRSYCRSSNDKCSPRFEICIGYRSEGKCSGELVTIGPFMWTSSIVFERTLPPNNVPNPFEMQKERLEEYLLVVKVKQGSGDGRIADGIANIRVSTPTNFNRKFLMKQKTLKMRKSKLTIEYSVAISCATDYYGSNCSILCKRPLYWDEYTCATNGSMICKKGYINPNRNCQVRDPCYSKSPCKSNGKCQQRDMDGDYICKCKNNYIGKNCELKNPCASNPCRNGGKCQMLDKIIGNYTCLCQPGYGGSGCKVTLTTTEDRKAFTTSVVIRKTTLIPSTTTIQFAASTSTSTAPATKGVAVTTGAAATNKTSIEWPTGKPATPSTSKSYITSTAYEERTTSAVFIPKGPLYITGAISNWDALKSKLKSIFTTDDIALISTPAQSADGSTLTKLEIVVSVDGHQVQMEDIKARLLATSLDWLPRTAHLYIGKVKEDGTSAPSAMTGVIIGATVGGIFILLAIVIAVVITRRFTRKSTSAQVYTEKQDEKRSSSFEGYRLDTNGTANTQYCNPVYDTAAGVMSQQPASLHPPSQ